MLALTRAMRRRLERTNLLRTCGVLTTARTEKPVSMKYRGPMKLLKRGEKDGEKYLNYIALWPQSGQTATEQEAYREWWKRFGKN
jgi:hypothetical protein